MKRKQEMMEQHKKDVSGRKEGAGGIGQGIIDRQGVKGRESWGRGIWGWSRKWGGGMKRSKVYNRCLCVPNCFVNPYPKFNLCMDFCN